MIGLDFVAAHTAEFFLAVVAEIAFGELVAVVAVAVAFQVAVVGIRQFAVLEKTKREVVVAIAAVAVFVLNELVALVVALVVALAVVLPPFDNVAAENIAMAAPVLENVVHIVAVIFAGNKLVGFVVEKKLGNVVARWAVVEIVPVVAVEMIVVVASYIQTVTLVAGNKLGMVALELVVEVAQLVELAAA